jgi:diadenosine tetraphosphatase ApaH/serine/threonine PP2A family protein phosphatase
MDDVFYCPECFVEHRGTGIDDFSVVDEKTEKSAAIEEEITTCPVCFEGFDVSSRPARRLACGDFICEDCIRNDFLDDAYFCPECCAEHKGSSIDDFSVVTDRAVKTPDLSDTDTDYNSDASSTYGISDFAKSPTAPIVRAQCTHPGCTNKAITNEFCLEHIKKTNRKVAEIGNVAEDMARASFRTLSTSGKKLKTLQRTEPYRPEELVEIFKKQNRIELGEVIELIERCKAVMRNEPNILNLEAPVITVGDIHGQFYDLLNMLDEGGPPGAEDAYLFLGDYVDRGSFSCEVILLLISYKVRFPDKVYLIRGNHECGSVSGHFGFKEECKIKYGLSVYYKFLLLFQTMPLAAVISTAYGDIFACHGGLSPSWTTLEDVNKIDRFIEPEGDPALLDILWSDPVPEEAIETMNDDEYEAFMNIEYKGNAARGCSYAFGYKALREFLDKNNLVCVVRAHEVQEDGYKKHFDPAVVQSRIRKLLRKRTLSTVDFKRDDIGTPQGKELKIEIGESDFPPLITIFSAPNYCDRYENKAAILRIDIALDGFRVIQYDCVEHPNPEIHESQTDNNIMAIISACPYMPTSFRNFVRMALEMGPEEQENFVGDDWDGEETDTVSMTASEGASEDATDGVSDSDLSTKEVSEDPAKGESASPKSSNCTPEKLRRSSIVRRMKMAGETLEMFLKSRTNTNPMHTRSSKKFLKAQRPKVAKLPRRRETQVISMVHTSLGRDDDSRTSEDDISEGNEDELDSDDADDMHLSANPLRKMAAVEDSTSQLARESSQITQEASCFDPQAPITKPRPAKRASATSLLFNDRNMNDDIGGMHSVYDEPPVPSSSSGGSQTRKHKKSHEELQDLQRKSLDLLFEKISVTDNPMIESKRAKEKKKPRQSFYMAKSEAYIEAMASDSINEVHPERLGAFFNQGPAAATGSPFGTFPSERVKPDQALGRVHEFEQLLKAAAEDAPSISVKDLRNRYLSNADKRGRSDSKSIISEADAPEAGKVKNLLANWKTVTKADTEHRYAEERKSKKGHVVFESSISESGGVSALRERFNSRGSRSNEVPNIGYRKSSSASKSSSRRGSASTFSDITDDFASRRSTMESIGDTLKANTDGHTDTNENSQSHEGNNELISTEMTARAVVEDLEIQKADECISALSSPASSPASSLACTDECTKSAGKKACHSLSPSRRVGEPPFSTIEGVMEEEMQVEGAGDGASGSNEGLRREADEDIDEDADDEGDADAEADADADADADEITKACSHSTESHATEIAASVQERRASLKSPSSTPSILFNQMEVLALKLMFSLFDRFVLPILRLTISF